MLELPANQSDVLTVLARTGGLPGPDAANEVIIQRGYGVGVENWPTDANGNYCAPTIRLDEDKEAEGKEAEGKDAEGRPRTIRIPLRARSGDSPTFRPEDVMLKSGDIVFIPALDAQVYYTGGILPSREVPLPRDYDLRAIEALVRVGGPFINGGIASNNISGSIIGAGVGTPSPSLLTILRKTPDGTQVTIRVDLNRAARDPREDLIIQDGDLLVLQETPQESFTRYVTQVFNFNIIGELWRGRTTTSTFTGNLP